MFLVAKWLPKQLAVRLILGLCLLSGESAADDSRPSTGKLVLAGAAMGIPTYMLGVAVHEGSHALAGTLLGATVKDYSLTPGFHPRTDKFYFGYVTVSGLRTQKQRALFLVAPKISDTVVLGAYSLVYASDWMPSNHYAETAILVLATGYWVDFSKDILGFRPQNDTVKLYQMMGLDTELKRLPARLLHLGISVAWGYAIYRGYRDLFGTPVGNGGSGSRDDQAFVLPVMDLSF